MAKKNPLKKRVQLVVDENVLMLIDEYSKQNGISRSGAISVLCTEALSQKKFMNTFPSLLPKILDDKK